MPIVRDVGKPPSALRRGRNPRGRRVLKGDMAKRFAISLFAASLCAAAGALLLPAGPAMASNTTRLKLVESKAKGLESDGVRYAAWSTSPQRIVRLDTRDRRRRASSVPTCFPEDAAWGQLLLSCTDYPPARRAVVMSLGAGTSQAIRTASGLAGHYFEIGRFWLEGNTCSNQCVRTWVNWRTQEYRSGTGTAADNFRDLDTPGLEPVRREATDVVVYAGKNDDSLLLVQGKKKTVLSRCRQFCYSFKVRRQGRRVVWAEGATVRAYDVATGKRARWTFSLSRQVNPRLQPLTVRNTSREVLVAVPRSDRLGGTKRVYSARWP